MPFHIEPEDKVQRWASICFNTLKSHVPLECGVEMHTGFVFYRTRAPDPLPWYSKMTNMSVVTSTEDSRVPSRYAAALRFTAPIVSMEIYLDWLHGNLVDKGVRVVTTLPDWTFDAVTAFARQKIGTHVVVNCTGVGARTFVNDDAVSGGRGVILFGRRTEEQNAFDFFMSESETDGYNPPGSGLAYAFPRGGSQITMGGSIDETDSSLTADDTEIEGIRRRVGAIIPCLQTVQETNRWAGLRPLRHGGVRLELENVTKQGVTMVHCYGHGGGGVTTCWGCADEVAALVDVALAATI
jgi:D-amino-acid oxidase